MRSQIWELKFSAFLIDDYGGDDLETAAAAGVI